MPLYPLGISRRRDVPSVPKQAAGSVDMRWSLAGELACAFIDAPHQAVPPMLHAAALDAIHRRICVLPVRFGVALHDENEIRSMLQDRHDELLDHLIASIDLRNGIADRAAKSAGSTRRRRLIQAAIAAGLHRTSADPTIDGQMTTRNATARLCEQLVERLARLLSAVAKTAVLAIARDPAGIPRRTRPRGGLSEPRGEHAVAGRRSGSGADAYVILGPWPPYSFV